MDCRLRKPLDEQPTCCECAEKCRKFADFYFADEDKRIHENLEDWGG